MKHNEIYERIEDMKNFAWMFVRRTDLRSLPGTDPEDLAQEIILRCLSLSDSYDPSRVRLSTWVTAVARRAVQELLRRRSTLRRGRGRRTVSPEQCHREEAEPRLPQCLAAPDDEMENVLWRVDAGWIGSSAALRLNDRERTVLRLRFYEQRTLDECGARLGVCGERARCIEYHALRKLRMDAPLHMDTY